MNFKYRDEIATNMEKKSWWSFDVDVDNEKQVNQFMKRKINGGANKIYYNVNDGKRYLLTEQGLQPVTSSTTKEDIDTTVKDTQEQARDLEEQKKKEIGERFEYFSPSQKKTIEELKEKNLEVPFGGTGA
jgi:Sec7-like guanine-nucleotide exchange factor